MINRRSLFGFMAATPLAVVGATTDVALAKIADVRLSSRMAHIHVIRRMIVACDSDLKFLRARPGFSTIFFPWDRVAEERIYNRACDLEQLIVELERKPLEVSA